CRRVDSQKANRRVIEQLVKAGAFDAIARRTDRHRAQLLAALDAALEHGASEQRDKRSGQTSLFGMFAEMAPLSAGADAGHGAAAAAAGETYPTVEAWNVKELL